jgi:KDO2-lipid IV(A) lauroyltransferase
MDKPTKWLYKLKFHSISTKSQNTMQGEITEKYARLLEKGITSRPEYWLWSHRRWKRSHLKDDNVIL